MIETTHIGSLPRPLEVAELLFAREKKLPLDPVRSRAIFDRAVEEAVARQREIGIDLPSDGEMAKISYVTYIEERLSGFAGDSARVPPADLERFPEFLQRQARGGGTPAYRKPECVGPVESVDLSGLEAGLSAMRAALEKSSYEKGFMNSPSPGVVALFHPNRFYQSETDYLEAVANAMSREYKKIVDAGLTLQIDAPDLALGRHMLYKDLSDAEFVRLAGRNVDLLNQALSGLPAESLRLHICWGNYEGPHICDIPIDRIMPEIARAKPRALLFEAANPRHQHEWTFWGTKAAPGDKHLIPGLIDSTSNFVEHPELVAQRLERFVGLVGPERLSAGTDCGFGTFAGFGAVNGEIAWKKLEALVEGTALVNRRLSGGKSS